MKPADKRKLSASERQAIQLMVALSDQDSPDIKARVEAWLQASDSNVLAWQGISASMQPVAIAADIRIPRGRLVDRVLNRDITRRLVLRSMIGFGVVGGVGVPITERFVSLGDLTADHLTLTGERRRFQLADGSQIVMGARSAIDVDLTPSERSITLRAGEMWIQSVVNPQTPLLISTPALRLRGPGGTYVARRNEFETSLSTIDANATVYGLHDESFAVPQGRRITFNGSTIRTRVIDSTAEEAWIDGLLFVTNETLSSLVARLRPYTTAVVHVDEDVANERVSGIFPLTDIPHALNLIETALDVVAQRRTPYWITIERSPRSA